MLMLICMYGYVLKNLVSMNGRVVFLKRDGSYGFLEDDDDGESHFFHIPTDWRSSSPPRMGDYVTYDIGNYRSRSCAINVIRIKSGEDI